MTFTKKIPADLNSPCRELSNGGLGVVVTNAAVIWGYHNQGYLRAGIIT